MTSHKSLCVDHFRKKNGMNTLHKTIGDPRVAPSSVRPPPSVSHTCETVQAALPHVLSRFSRQLRGLLSLRSSGERWSSGPVP